jgi:Domain of unknown function (DUF4296)
MRNLIYFLTLVVFFACNTTPNNILPEKKMRAVLWDILKADAYTQELYARDTNQKDMAIKNAALQHQIFTLHQVSKETFYNSYNYYKADATLYKALMDSLNATIPSERYQQYDKYKNGYKGDTNNTTDTTAPEK